MNREEVLKRAQNTKHKKLDEMEIDILLKSNRVGLVAGLIVCLVIMGGKLYLHQPYQDIYAVLGSILCGQHIYKGVRQRDKFLVFIGCVWGITALILMIGSFL